VTLDAASGSLPPDDVEGREAAPAPPRAPVLRVRGFLRLTAGASVVSAALGLIVAPGLRGVAADAVVDPVNRVAWALAYWMCGLVVTTIVLAILELTRAWRLHVVARATAIGAAAGVVALSTPAIARTLPQPFALALAAAASMACFASASEGLRRPHTRAVAIVFVTFAIAALSRVISWEIARAAGESSSVRLYALSRGIATGAWIIEALGQMFAAAWLGTRSRLLGQAMALAAVAGAFLLTWNAARGAGDFAAPWQTALHVALGSAPGLPQPFGLSALAVFLVVASILLALVAAVQPGELATLVFALSLGLLGRGAFDAPLRALSAAAGALWLMVTTAYLAAQPDSTGRSGEERRPRVAAASRTILTR
jgi:hypothetical protein